MNRTEMLTEWAISQIKAKYPDDVALLIGLEGHSVNGDGHGECFDYFVPATEKGNRLSQTFIIDGIGYDLYPRSWERTEKTANLEDTATLALGNAKILYSRSKQDEERFWALREKLFQNLANKEFTYHKALELLDIAMDLYRTMVFEDRLEQVRMAAGFIVHYLTLAVTFLNGTYEKDWTDGMLPRLRQLEHLPVNFIEYYQGILAAEGSKELKNLSELIIATSRRFIAANKPSFAKEKPSVNYENLADWYQELSLWWRRIHYYCAKNKTDAAFAEACQLQGELNIVQAEFGLEEMDLLGCYQPENLSLLAQRADELEAYIVGEIERNGVQIKKYDSVEAFLAQNK